jgi:hypothetical protein
MSDPSGPTDGARMTSLPVDLAPMPPMQATDWKVLYGASRELAAYFNDRERALQYARTHHGVVVPLAPV